MLTWKSCTKSRCVCVCVCVCLALSNQHAKHILYVILSRVLCWLYRIFPHYLINEKIFRKKDVEHKMCLEIFLQIRLETFFIRTIQRNIDINI